MAYDIIFSGFGGQGALFAGQLLAYAAMDAGRFVTWIPSYGPEMRGGTAHCTVIVSNEEIGSPLVRNPTAALVLNPPSMARYAPRLKPNGHPRNCTAGEGYRGGTGLSPNSERRDDWRVDRRDERGENGNG